MTAKPGTTPIALKASALLRTSCRTSAAIDLPSIRRARPVGSSRRLEDLFKRTCSRRRPLFSRHAKAAVSASDGTPAEKAFPFPSTLFPHADCAALRDVWIGCCVSERRSPLPQQCGETKTACSVQSMASLGMKQSCFLEPKYILKKPSQDDAKQKILTN